MNPANLATPPGDCPLCALLNRRESQVLEKFRQAFAHRHQALIYLQGDPRVARGQAWCRAKAAEDHHGAALDLPALSR